MTDNQWGIVASERSHDVSDVTSAFFAHPSHRCNRARYWLCTVASINVAKSSCHGPGLKLLIEPSFPWQS